MTPSRTTPVATPLPGFEIVIVSRESRPTRTGAGGSAVSLRAARVARARTDASARKLTLATLPTSPSCIGIKSRATRACPPGGSVPSCQTRSLEVPGASASPGAGVGAAGGVVATSAVPNGTESRRTTSLAVALPTFRTRISNRAVFPTWISRGPRFSTASCGVCTPSSWIAPGRPWPLGVGGIAGVCGPPLPRDRAPAIGGPFPAATGGGPIGGAAANGMAADGALPPRADVGED